MKSLLDPLHDSPDRRLFIRKDEEKLIRQRFSFAASHGFSLDVHAMRNIKAQIASNGRKGFKTEFRVPSDDATRPCRVRNRDVTYRTAGNKSVSKF